MLVRRIVSSFLSVGVVLVAAIAEAQSSAGAYVITCPQSAPNLSLLRDALRNEVKNSIDVAQFTSPTVGISLRRISLDTQPQTVTLPSVLGQLELGTGTPPGLGFTLSGATDFAIDCEWTYRVRISTRARNVSNNQVVTAVTNSDVKVQRRVFTRWRRATSTP